MNRVTIFLKEQTGTLVNRKKFVPKTKCSLKKNLYLESVSDFMICITFQVYSTHFVTSSRTPCAIINLENFVLVSTSRPIKTIEPRRHDTAQSFQLHCVMSRSILQ